MDFWQAVQDRQSVRAFDKERDVPSETVTRLLEVAIRAPSAGNCQPWQFVVVRDEDTKRDLARAALDQWFLAEAPVVVVVCSDPERSAGRYGERGRQLYAVQDTAAATENLLLAVSATGLGACWVGAFDEEAVSQALDLDPRLRPLSIIPIGYPAQRPRGQSERLPLKSVIKLIT